MTAHPTSRPLKARRPRKETPTADTCGERKTAGIAGRCDDAGASIADGCENARFAAVDVSGEDASVLPLPPGTCPAGVVERSTAASRRDAGGP
jgi:hypothetical protein